jgi:hypothetical protein
VIKRKIDVGFGDENELIPVLPMMVPAACLGVRQQAHCQDRAQP